MSTRIRAAEVTARFEQMQHESTAAGLDTSEWVLAPAQRTRWSTPAVPWQIRRRDDSSLIATIGATAEEALTRLTLLRDAFAAVRRGQLD